MNGHIAKPIDINIVLKEIRKIRMGLKWKDYVIY
jgi:hypothetical protein